MKIRRPLIFVYALLFVSGCSTVTVSTDYDKSLDFSALKTFEWHTTPVKTSGYDTGMRQSLMESRIRGSIDNQLASQGFQKQVTNPDFLVNYSVTTQEKTDIRTYDSYGGYGPGWGWGAGYGHRGMVVGVRTETRVEQYQKGTLIIDIIDPKTNQLIWRGLGSRRLPSTSTSEIKDQLVNEVVSSILVKFPPK